MNVVIPRPHPNGEQFPGVGKVMRSSFQKSRVMIWFGNPEALRSENE